MSNGTTLYNSVSSSIKKRMLFWDEVFNNSLTTKARKRGESAMQAGMMQLDPSKRPNIDQILEYTRAMATPNPPEIDLSHASQSICDRLTVLSIDGPTCAAALTAKSQSVRLPESPRHALLQIHTLFFSHADTRSWELGTPRMQYGVLLCVVAWLLRLMYRREDAELLESAVLLVERNDTASQRMAPTGELKSANRKGQQGTVHQGARNSSATNAAVPYAIDDAAVCSRSADVMVEAAAAVGVDVRSVEQSGLLRGYGASVCALLDMLLLLTERRLQLRCSVPSRLPEADEPEVVELLHPDYSAEMRIDICPTALPSSRFIHGCEEEDNAIAYSLSTMMYLEKGLNAFGPGRSYIAGSTQVQHNEVGKTLILSDDRNLPTGRIIPATSYASCLNVVCTSIYTSC